MGLAGALFFARGHLLQGLEAHRQSLVQEVEAAPEAHVLKVDEAQWTRALFDRYAVEAPILKREDAYMEQLRAAQVDVSWDSSRLIRSRPVYVPGHKTVVHVPFTGEKDIFHFLPSSHILVQLHARVTDDELLIDIEYPDDRPLDITAYTDKFIERVETNLTNARADIAKFNTDLEKFAMNAIVTRRERIEKHLAHAVTTGLPIKHTGDPEKASIPEVITRRAAPLLPTLREGEPMELEPVLLDEHYEHTLSVIRQHTLSMERDPQAYASMGEEARRRVILDALNTHYQGAGSPRRSTSAARPTSSSRTKAGAFSSPSASSGRAPKASPKRSTSSSAIRPGGTPSWRFSCSYASGASRRFSSGPARRSGPTPSSSPGRTAQRRLNCGRP